MRNNTHEVFREGRKLESKFKDGKKHPGTNACGGAGCNGDTNLSENFEIYEQSKFAEKPTISALSSCQKSE